MEAISSRRAALNPNPVGRDLPLRFTTTGNTYAREAYQGVLKDEEVDNFLQEEDLYNASKKQWMFSLGGEGLLRGTFDVLRRIVRRFVVPEMPGVERRVMTSEHTPGCDDRNEDGYRVCPILLVRATGPSFEIPDPEVELDGGSRCESSVSVGSSNIATYFVVRMAEELGSDEDVVKEMESYARSIFCGQQNRFYVRSLVITERYARLVHIDRSGAELTPPIDIHQDPGTLIRIVAGLSSTNERLLGIDDSIQWNIVNDRKAEGTLMTTGPGGVARKFRILESILFPPDTILGRATTCWRVQDPETLEEYIVKDGWRPHIVEPEHDMLELVKGLPGVVQMVSYETGRGEIKDFRCPTTFGQYFNRIASRTTTKAYGKSIACFTSILQPLYALRDAIAGHQRLCGSDIRILHRDISHNNVLLGLEGSPVGERGILIDFDLAFKATDAEPTVLTNYNIGTRLFQSVSVLESSLTHDHTDELESFFYLMAFILLLFKPDGTRVPSNAEGPTMIWAWGARDIEVAEESKKGFRDFGLPAMRSYGIILESWGQECADLFQNFRYCVMERADEKSDIFDDDGQYGGDVQKRAEAAELFYSRRDEHYAEVLQMFDEATNGIKASIPAPSEDVTTPAIALLDSPAAHGPPPLQPSCNRTANVECSLVPCPILMALDPTVKSTSSAHVATSKSPARVGLSPIPLSPSLSPAVPTPLRRSARIEVRLQKSRQCPVPALDAPISMKNKITMPSQCAAAGPRRSARIQKRRLEEEEQASTPQRKVRRTTKAPRRPTRCR